VFSIFQFRDAHQEDFKVIASFAQNQEEAFYFFPKATFPVAPEQLEEAASVRFSPTVILYKDEVAGYCNFYEVNEGKECWLGNVIVNPSYRKSGVGSYLIEVMKKKAAEQYKANALHLICHNSNTKALLFYYKQGFKPYDLKLINNKGASLIGIMLSIPLEK